MNRNKAVKHLFIVNPAAGNRNRTREICQKINSLNFSGGYAVEITARPGEAGSIAESYACRSQEELRIYACGGDGTLYEVVNGVFKYKHCSVGPIPIGSGNDFIRGFEEYNASDFLDIQRMIRGESRAIDTIDVNGHISINVTSVGFDAHVNRRMTSVKKLPVVGGGNAYKLSCALSIIDKMKHSFIPVVDGNPIIGEGPYLLAAIGNKQYYGGGFKVTPLAVDDDGLLDFVRIPHVSRLFFSRFVAKFRRGEHIALDEVRFTRCKSVQFLSEKPLVVNVDGETFILHNPSMRVVPKSLKIILPEKTELRC